MTCRDRTRFVLEATLIAALLLPAAAGADAIRQQILGTAQKPAADDASSWNLEPRRQSRVEWGGWTSPAYLSLSEVDNDAASTDSLRSLLLLDNRLWARWDWSGGQNFYLRLRHFELKYDLAPGAAKPSIFEEGFNIDQAYWDMPWGPWSFRPGRQYVAFGRGLTFSGALDGVVASYAKGQVQGRVIRGRTPRFVTDWDPLVGRSNRMISGVTMEYHTPSDHRLFLYQMRQEQRDHRETNKQGLDYNTRYLAAGAAGPVANDIYYYFEGIEERGASPGLGAPDRFTPVDADAVLADLEWRPDRRHHPTAKLGFAQGSGDPDRQSVSTSFLGNVRNTEDNAFIGLGQFDGGLAFSPRLSNLRVFSLGGTFNLLEPPGDDDILTVGADLFFYQKEDPRGRITQSSATNVERDVGRGLDLKAAWKPGHDMSVSVQASRFQPGDAFVATAREPSTVVFATFTYSY